MHSEDTSTNRGLKKADADALTVMFGTLFGATVVPKSEYDKINEEKEKLLKEVKDIKLLQIKLFLTECKLQAFVRFHRKWKPTIRQFQKRGEKLKREKLIIDFNEYPKNISENLQEAYKCYLNGLDMACYIMILRSIELSVNFIYDKENETIMDANGKPKFVSASNKLNWVKNQGYISGADFLVAKGFIEARNESIHQVYTPTNKQIMAAIETVITLIRQIKTKSD